MNCSEYTFLIRNRSVRKTRLKIRKIEEAFMKRDRLSFYCKLEKLFLH